MKQLEFFYDFSCPYAYLASTQLRALAARAGAELVYKPFLLGGVFKALGNAAPNITPMSGARARMNMLDMRRWAEHWKVPLNMPPGHPNRTVLALRTALASSDLPRASHALFAAYWIEGRDLSDPHVIARTLTQAGFDGAELLRRAETPEIKQQLFERTDEAVRRGVFGAPTCFVNGERLWGQDRLDFVARALGVDEEPAKRGGLVVSELELWFDFSSPFAYLASTQMTALAERTGARIKWRPFLLGGLFRSIGTPDVPLFSFAPAKQSFMREDMERYAHHYGVPFAFPSRFPLRTVLPLRVVLLAGERGAALARAFFDAAWADDRDISDPSVLRGICDEHRVDPELVRRAEEPEAKQLLKSATDEAAARGLCGAPSFIVGDSLFWGQDRLLFVEKALRGWRPRADHASA